MTSGIKVAALVTCAIALAPIVIFATPRSGGPVAYVVPLSFFPVPGLLADVWPSPQWSAATLVVFGITIGVTWAAVRRAGDPPWWQAALPLAILSLAGSAVVMGSFALLGSVVIALIWSGLASAAWNLMLLFQLRTLRPGLGQVALFLWVAGAIAFSLFGALFGLMTGLCC